MQQSLCLVLNKSNELYILFVLMKENHAIRISNTLFSGKFGIPDGSLDSYISSKRQTYDRKFMSLLFGVFFNISKITQTWRQKKLHLSYRVTFVNRHEFGYQVGDQDLSSGETRQRYRRLRWQRS
ncbi:hypothetical protein BDC45DRAFT_561362 [Circinella umbellata]|nr:hypothetical protein BDC45DRAFT_561362 [Circinella umbellata]